MLVIRQTFKDLTQAKLEIIELFRIFLLLIKFYI